MSTRRPLIDAAAAPPAEADERSQLLRRHCYVFVRSRAPPRSQTDLVRRFQPFAFRRQRRSASPRQLRRLTEPPSARFPSAPLDAIWEMNSRLLWVSRTCWTDVSESLSICQAAGSNRVSKTKAAERIVTNWSETPCQAGMWRPGTWPSYLCIFLIQHDREGRRMPANQK
jgi:hypothetical protein